MRQDHPFSTLQFWLHPSLLAVLPSSHSSPKCTSRVPFPQNTLSLGSPTITHLSVQIHPCSTWHKLLQPSPLFLLPSSQFSPLRGSVTPLPQSLTVWKQNEGNAAWPTQVYPDSTLHALQPSCLPLSHSSPASTTLLPHTGAAAAFFWHLEDSPNWPAQV
jgi:hypothetical protein